MDLVTVEKEKAKFNFLKMITLEKMKDEAEAEEMDQYLDKILTDRIIYEFLNLLKTKMQGKEISFGELVEEITQMEDEEIDKLAENINPMLKELGIELQDTEIYDIIYRSYIELNTLIYQEYLNLNPEDEEYVNQSLRNAEKLMDLLHMKDEYIIN